MRLLCAFLITSSVCLLFASGEEPRGTSRSTDREIVIDASAPPSPAKALPFYVGGRSPTGHVLSANSQYLLLDGKPWFPVMGEFHFSRYPEADWEEELLKMKAGGIQVVSTYIFWIHHEEIEGQFNWTGRRNLRHFVELCAKHNLYVWVRIGPWDHGEARNGGFPDWVVQKCKTRQTNPLFLSYVQRFYEQIGTQLNGLMWGNGGPVIGVQLENEYSARGPDKGAEYILALRRMARKAGLDVPFYTVTGWDNAVIPSRDILPVFGGYADAFWSRSVRELPPNANYFFTSIRCDENVGNDLQSRRPDIDSLDAEYPYLVAEMGGGTEVAYHRRPVLSADDTGAMALVKMGSGVAMFGYYVFHGGTNPDGEKTTLEESQATGYPNDLPVKSYDYEAPLGEFGEVNPSYRVLKTFHMFAADFGPELAEMPSYFPTLTPSSRQDISTPRVAARVRNGRGFIFINNYQRLYPLPERSNFQVRLRLPTQTLEAPRHPIEIPSQAYTIWPVNLKMGPAVLRYATAQLLCRLDDSNTYVFFTWPGIPAEFAFESKPGMEVESAEGKITRDHRITYVSGSKPGTHIALRLIDKDANSAQILLLSRAEALDAWKAVIRNKQRLILSAADLYFEGDSVRLLGGNAGDFSVSLFPAFQQSTLQAEDQGDDRVFRKYAVAPKPVSVAVEVRKLMAAGDPPPTKIERGVALAPDETEFDSASRWEIRVAPFDLSTVDNAYLTIRYEGDVARLYVGGKLFTDDFYDGAPWVIGLKDIPRAELSRLEVRILPLRKEAPIYLPKGAWPTFSSHGEIAEIDSVKVEPQYDAVMNFAVQSKPAVAQPSKRLKTLQLCHRGPQAKARVDP